MTELVSWLMALTTTDTAVRVVHIVKLQPKKSLQSDLIRRGGQQRVQNTCKARQQALESFMAVLTAMSTCKQRAFNARPPWPSRICSWRSAKTSLHEPRCHGISLQELKQETLS